MMFLLFELAEVGDKDKSPFCKSFALLHELIKEYIAYCLRTFSFDGICGQKEVKVSTDDNSDNQEINNSKAIAERICLFTQDLLSIHESSKDPEHAP
eukprot:3294609-Ditylum_brightwellii.AAC.1